MACSILRIYSPQIFGGGVGGGLTPPSASPPSFVDLGAITLEYPHTSPTVSLEIRAPDFNDSKTVMPIRDISRSRNNSLLIATDPDWPVVFRLKYAITHLSETNKADWMTFLMLL